MAKLFLTIFSLLIIFVLTNCEFIHSPPQFSNIIDHTCTNLSAIPTKLIQRAKQELHIAYGHTSHGSQLISGMTGLAAWKGDFYAWNEGGIDGALDINDYFVAGDLGNPDRTTWAARTREYLGDPDPNTGRGKNHMETNVIIWSWCGQVGSASEQDINAYLSLMTQLENDYPNVRFVYMTGHLDGTGESGNLHLRNEQIHSYCMENNKTLYDFADIESYDPDGQYFGNLYPDDNCDYDADGSPPRTETGNWALEWQNTHTEGVDWFDIEPNPAHTQDLNGNLKAYAAWWLWASLVSD